MSPVLPESAGNGDPSQEDWDWLGHAVETEPRTAFFDPRLHGRQRSQPELVGLLELLQVDDDLFERFGTALIDLSPQGDERVRVEPAGQPQLTTGAVEGERDPRVAARLTGRWIGRWMDSSESVTRATT